LSTSPTATGPALALLEVESIARGMVVADAVVKKAAVRILTAGPVSPGKYLLLFAGDVAEVEEGFAEGKRFADALLVDELFLPYAHEALEPAIRKGVRQVPQGAVGIVETQTVASALKSADAALKGAAVTMIQAGFARGIGGKGYYVLTGPLDDVEAALQAAAAAISPHLLLHAELITQPHADLDGQVF
jgi:microcompartment protein CcmL/EutN